MSRRMKFDYSLLDRDMDEFIDQIYDHLQSEGYQRLKDLMEFNNDFISIHHSTKNWEFVSSNYENSIVKKYVIKEKTRKNKWVLEKITESVNTIRTTKLVTLTANDESKNTISMEKNVETYVAPTNMNMGGQGMEVFI